MEWRHNDAQCKWELGYDDPYALIRDRPPWTVAAWITDEFITDVANIEAAAVHLHNKLGSVPPPLARLLPPEPGPVEYEPLPVAPYSPFSTGSPVMPVRRRREDRDG